MAHTHTANKKNQNDKDALKKIEKQTELSKPKKLPKVRSKYKKFTDNNIIFY